nr:MAG TPA: mRNA (guanine-7-)methyltransferase [Caudoviricetes sp.]
MHIKALLMQDGLTLLYKVIPTHLLKNGLDRMPVLILQLIRESLSSSKLFRRF